MVLSMYEGQMGVLWIGAAGGGVNRVDLLAGRLALFQNDADPLCLKLQIPVQSVAPGSVQPSFVGNHPSKKGVDGQNKG